MRSSAPHQRQPRRWPLLAIPCFAVLYLLVALRWHVSAWVAAAYLAASVVAFVAYSLDKSAARRGRWRTSEATLHGLGLTCGWPGALLAQQWLRHKTAKRSFIAGFWATVIANVAAYVALAAWLGGRPG